MHLELITAVSFAVAGTPAAFTERAAAARKAIEELTAQMNAGRQAGESDAQLCERTRQIWEAGRAYRDVNDDAFRLARSVFAQKRREDWKCPLSPADKKDPANRPLSLWDRFRQTRQNLEAAPSPGERARLQQSLRLAAVRLLHQLQPTDPRYQDVVDSLALSVVSKDTAVGLQAIVTALGPRDLEGPKGKVIADAVSKLAQQVPPKMFTEKQVDDLISFAIRLAKENPSWLQQESAGRLLSVVLRSLGELPPGTVGEEHAQAVFDFTAKMLAQDPRWLQGPRADVLVQFVPGLLTHVDVTKVKTEDLGVMLEFSTKIIAGRANWPAEVRKVIEDWETIVQIALDTKDARTRAIVRKAIDTLRQREGDAYKPLADEVSKAEPDPQVITSLLKALGVARVEEIRQEQAALESQEVVQAVFLRLRTLIGLRLPAGCHDRRRDGGLACKTVLAFVDAFRTNVVSGGPEGADFGPEIDTSVPDALTRAECTLQARADCEGFKGYAGTFASFVSIEIVPVAAAGGSGFEAEAGCVVVTAGRVVDRIEQVGVVRFGAAPDQEHAALIAAEALAGQVLARCPLSRPHSDFATELRSKGHVNPDVSASSALVFAGLPYLRDDRVPAPVARRIAAADFVSLAIGAGGVISGVYMHNVDDGPWGDRLLRVGLVALGTNLLVKVGATLYYAVHYGHR